ncbi:unnamed protein product [Mesocestoides corti]|uniref:Ig-like domain-containing protein n=1 Tax=Mesocestoides corti TaxID=53468 RepID=A0A0R3UNY1_MESCO|nr:unnamed protein product [Mesocestoides corti]
MILPKSDDESSLSYYTAEGPIMHLARQGSTKQRPDSILSLGVTALPDSVNTLDGVANPFLEQIPEHEGNGRRVSEVVLTHSIRTDKPFEHQAELQDIDSCEGGEMELTIETSTSDTGTYTSEWTFNGAPLDPDKMEAYPRIEGNAAYLFVPKVSRELHEGRYECILSWTSGMRAIFPFAVHVHEPEDDVAPTNESSKLNVKTVKITEAPVADEEEGGFEESQELEMSSMPMSTQQDKETDTSSAISTHTFAESKHYRAVRTSIIEIQHEPRVVEVPSTVDAVSESRSISSTVSPEVEKHTFKTVELLIQEYIEPIQLTGTAGETLTITAHASVNSTSRVWWTLNGKKLSSSVFGVQRRGSEVELSTSQLLKSDSGEYALWVDDKMVANFFLNVEEKAPAEDSADQRKNSTVELQEEVSKDVVLESKEEFSEGDKEEHSTETKGEVMETCGRKLSWDADDQVEKTQPTAELDEMIDKDDQRKKEWKDEKGEDEMNKKESRDDRFEDKSDKRIAVEEYEIIKTVEEPLWDTETENVKVKSTTESNKPARISAVPTHKLDETRTHEVLVEEPKEAEQPTPKEEPVDTKSTSDNVVNLMVGDKFTIAAAVPLDVRQLKNERLWWTRDGRVFSDVDGPSPRGAKFTSRSKLKPPKSTEVELIKKEGADVDDAGTYILQGEPRIKRGFKPQITTYATFVVAVKEPVHEMDGEQPRVSAESPVSTKPKVEEEIEVEAAPVPDELVKNDEKSKDQANHEMPPVDVSEPAVESCREVETTVEKNEVADEVSKREKRKSKTKSRDTGDGSKKKHKKKSVPSADDVASAETTESRPIETVELRCIEANANRRLGNDKIPIPAGEPLCLTITGIPPEVAAVEWTLNGQPVRTGKRVQRLLEPNPLGRHYEGELMAQLYLDTTVLLDSGDYEIRIKPTERCPITAHLSIPVDIISARKELSKRRRMEKEEEESVLQVQPNLCQPLGFSACEGEPLSLVADLNVPLENVPPESVSWSRNGVPLSPDDPTTAFSIQQSPQNREHTSVILSKPAVTLDDVGFYSVTYNPLPTIKEEPLAEEEDEEGYGIGWEVDFPELLVFPADERQKSTLPSPPIITKELPKEIRVSEGDTITLDAEVAEGTTDITPVWSVNGRQIDATTTSEYVVWNSGNYFALMIPAASRHHLGVYDLKLATSPQGEATVTSCKVKAKDAFGTRPLATPQSANSAVDGIAPMFTKKLSDVDSWSGEAVKLTCRVFGDPIPHFFWSHNGEILEPDEHRRIRTMDGTSTLTIPSVTPQDRGTYICSAVNELGTTQTTANVSVDGSCEVFSEDELQEGRTRPVRYSVPRLAPDGLMLDSATPSELTMHWNPASEGLGDVTYTIEMSKDNGYFWSPIVTGLKTTNATIPDTIASPLQPLQFRVHVENAFGTGPPSQPVLKIPVRATVPNMDLVKPTFSNADLGFEKVRGVIGRWSLLV